jgi:hypothetical protein
MKPRAYTDDYIRDIRYLYGTGRYTQRRLAEMYFPNKDIVDNYCEGVRKPHKRDLYDQTDFD